jgi:hypothetical protein
MRADIDDIADRLRQLLADRGLTVRISAARKCHATLTVGGRGDVLITRLGDGRLRLRFGTWDLTTVALHTTALPAVCAAIVAGCPNGNREAWHRVREQAEILEYERA